MRPRGAGAGILDVGGRWAAGLPLVRGGAGEWV